MRRILGTMAGLALAAGGITAATTTSAGPMAPTTANVTMSNASATTTSTTSSTCNRTLSVYPVLKPGMRSDAVRTLQCLINDVGHGLGPVVVDGYYGPQTKAAVDRLASGTEGVPDTTGRFNNSDWVQLISLTLPERTLTVGSTGASVTTLQRALRAQGFVVTVDGTFGTETKVVVRQFQKFTGNATDGVVGESTRFALYSGGSGRLAN